MTADSRSGNSPEGLAGGGDGDAARVRAVQADATDEDSPRFNAQERPTA